MNTKEKSVLILILLTIIVINAMIGNIQNENMKKYHQDKTRQDIYSLCEYHAEKIINK
jgi:hypothetical protein